MFFFGDTVYSSRLVCQILTTDANVQLIYTTATGWCRLYHTDTRTIPGRYGNMPDSGM